MIKRKKIVKIPQLLRETSKKELKTVENDKIVSCSYLFRGFKSGENADTNGDFSLKSTIFSENLSSAKAGLEKLSASSLGCDLLLKLYVKSIVDRGFLACRNCYWLLSSERSGQKINRINRGKS